MDVITIRKWLRELDQALENARSFGPIVIGLNKGECLNRVQQILANLPADIDKAERVLRETHRLVGGAQHQAQLTLEQAEEQARQIIERHGKKPNRSSNTHAPNNNACSAKKRSAASPPPKPKRWSKPHASKRIRFGKAPTSTPMRC